MVFKYTKGHHVSSDLPNSERFLSATICQQTIRVIYQSCQKQCSRERGLYTMSHMMFLLPKLLKCVRHVSSSYACFVKIIINHSIFLWSYKFAKFWHYQNLALYSITSTCSLLFSLKIMLCLFL